MGGGALGATPRFVQDAGIAVPRRQDEGSPVLKNLRVASAALLMAAPLMAHAAGFDCARAGSPSEKAVCATPKVSALDGKLAEAFRTALKNHPDKADALKLDQRHWLAERDAAVADFLSSSPGKVLPVNTAQYQARIDFLRGLDTKVPKPLDAVQTALSHLPAGSYDVLADLAKAGVNIAVAEDVPVEDAKALPYEPDPDLRKALAEVDASSGYRRLPGMQ